MTATSTSIAHLYGGPAAIISIILMLTVFPACFMRYCADLAKRDRAKDKLNSQG